VRFTTTAALVSELIEARDEKKLLRFQKLIAKKSRSTKCGRNV
jgi:hypothetical protein